MPFSKELRKCGMNAIENRILTIRGIQTPPFARSTDFEREGGLTLWLMSKELDESRDSLGDELLGPKKLATVTGELVCAICSGRRTIYQWGSVHGLMLNSRTPEWAAEVRDARDLNSRRHTRRFRSRPVPCLCNGRKRHQTVSLAREVENRVRTGARPLQPGWLVALDQMEAGGWTTPRARWWRSFSIWAQTGRLEQLADVSWDLSQSLDTLQERMRIRHERRIARTARRMGRAPGLKELRLWAIHEMMAADAVALDFGWAPMPPGQVVLAVDGVDPTEVADRLPHIPGVIVRVEGGARSARARAFVRAAFPLGAPGQSVPTLTIAPEPLPSSRADVRLEWPRATARCTWTRFTDHVEVTSFDLHPRHGRG